MCQTCFQKHYQNLMHNLNRQWCMNHNNGCLSEVDDYKPLPGIQSYTLPGRPGGKFKPSGMFMLGYYCGACSLWNVAHAKEWAEQANEVPVFTAEKKRSRSLSPSEALIDQLQHLPNKTEQQAAALKQATEIHIRLKLREKKLKAEQQDLEEVLKNLASVIAPTEDD